MSEKTCALIKDVEVKGGNIQFLVNTIRFPLIPTALYPFNITKPYVLWKPLSIPSNMPYFSWGNLQLKNRKDYAEQLKLVPASTGKPIVTVYFEHGKKDDATNEIIKATTKGSTFATYDISIEYDGKVIEVLEAQGYYVDSLNTFLSKINTSPTNAKYT